ncbi:MAG TPA: hypothetical protein VFN35_26560, partial [Ktedonobacteraceae bacterium]|nr:hypothetical protein [Ktedonobacteraceae bacterium]
MTTEELLSALETLPHTARVSRMIELGRRAQAEAETAALLAEMARGNWYERYLSLYACFGSANSAQVLSALNDPARHISGLALRLLPLVCNEEQLQQALRAASPGLKRPVFWKLFHHGYQSVIDDFVEELTPNDAHFYVFLCFASDAVILRNAQLFLQQAQRSEWSHLVRLHPEAAIELLLQWADKVGKEEKQLVTYFNDFLPRLVLVRPEQCLQLLRTLLSKFRFSELRVQSLATRYPEEIADLILAQEEHVSLDGGLLLPHLSQEKIQALCSKQRYFRNAVSRWFPLLSLEQRLFLYTNHKQFLHSDYDDSIEPPTLEA